VSGRLSPDPKAAVSARYYGTVTTEHLDRLARRSRAVSDRGRGVSGTSERTPTRGRRHHRRMIGMQYLVSVIDDTPNSATSDEMTDIHALQRRASGRRPLGLRGRPRGAQHGDGNRRKGR
jgi:hypothetical protein